MATSEKISGKTDVPEWLQAYIDGLKWEAENKDEAIAKEVAAVEANLERAGMKRVEDTKK